MSIATGIKPTPSDFAIFLSSSWITGKIIFQSEIAAVKFKFKNLKQLILDNYTKPLQQQKLILDNTFESWKGSLEQVDDVCVIGVKI